MEVAFALLALLVFVATSVTLFLKRDVEGDARAHPDLPLLYVVAVQELRPQRQQEPQPQPPPPFASSSSSRSSRLFVYGERGSRDGA